MQHRTAAVEGCDVGTIVNKVIKILFQEVQNKTIVVVVVVMVQNNKKYKLWQ